VATEVFLPRVDMDMTEGKVSIWHVRNGDTVRKGQALFDIETDKAAMEIESPADGIIAIVRGETDVSMPVGEAVAWILEPGESVPGGGADGTSAQSSERPAEVPAETAASGASQAPAEGLRLVRATPLARYLAQELGLGLATLQGSGPWGRVRAQDVLAQAGEDALPHLAHWRDAGTPPLVLLHGFGTDHRSWKPLVEALPDKVSVLAFDLPGHGRSRHCSAISVGDMAEQLLQRLDQSGVGEFHLLGHSLGGAVGIELARRSGARLRSLCLLAPAGLGDTMNQTFVQRLLDAEDDQALRGALQLLVHDPDRITPSFVAAARQQLGSEATRRQLRRLARRLLPPRLPEAVAWLARPGIPAAVIWGRDDQVLDAGDLQRLPQGLRLRLLDGVGHLPHVEAPQEVAATVHDVMH
jgi:pyruvate dehydrogenase E2 component (dihydrolipoamide acetyltransferase)